MQLKAKLFGSGLVALLLAGYLGSWFFLPELGLAGPMANLAYFYYGESHEKSDSVLYIVYFPLYWIETKLNGRSRYGIHWSDRKDATFSTLDELRKEGYTNEELKDMGFTDERLKERRKEP